MPEQVPGSQPTLWRTGARSARRCSKWHGNVGFEGPSSAQTVFAYAADWCLASGQTIRRSVRAAGTEGGWRPEGEKSGLLPPRPALGGPEEASAGQGRMTADVWLPGGQSGSGEVLTIALSSGMQANRFWEAASSAEHVFERSENPSGSTWTQHSHVPMQVSKMSL